MPRKDMVSPRGGTAALWASRNPILAYQELGSETDTKKMKIGDGTTSWNDLPYVTGPVDGDNVSLQVKRDTDANLSAITTPFLSGQIVYGLTTGKMVIGDGESSFNGLPDIRKQFQNVVTVAKTGKVGSADFICSDSQWGGDDAACIQTSLDYAQSGSCIVFMPGIYNLLSRVVLTGKNLTLISIGDVTFIHNTGIDYVSALQFQGSYTTMTTLSFDANVNSRTISLESVEDVYIGDLLIISKNMLWCPNDYPEQLTGEMYEITSISENIITLNQPLLRDYKLSETVNVYICHPIEIHINGINFIGPSATGSTEGCELKFCINSSIKNCRFSNVGKSTVNIVSCFNTIVDSNVIYGAITEGFGYGICILDCSAFVKIINNRIENCRHVIAAGTKDIGTNNLKYVGLNRGIVIDHNTLSGGASSVSATIDSHPNSIDYIVTNNNIYPGTMNIEGYVIGCYAFTDGTQRSIFSNNYIYGGGGVTRRGYVPFGHHIISNNIIDTSNGASLYGRNNTPFYETANTLIIENNELTNCNFVTTSNYGCGIYIENENFNVLRISGNIIDTCSYSGIMYIQPNTETPAIIDISHNTVKNTQRDGIFIRKTNSSSQMSVIIESNLLLNTGLLSGGYGCAIAIYDINEASISQNVISGAYIGLKESVLLGSNISNSIDHNKFNGCSTYAYYTLYPTESNFYENKGYVTENTGIATVPAATTSIAVTHGLAATPTKIIVSPSSSTEGIDYYVPTGLRGATTFTITMASAPTGNVSFDWSAEV